MEEVVDVTNKAIMAIDAKRHPEINPDLHKEQYSFNLLIRHEMVFLKHTINKKRRAAMRRLFEEDIKQEDAELRLLGRGYLVKYP